MHTTCKQKEDNRDTGSCFPKTIITISYYCSNRMNCESKVLIKLLHSSVGIFKMVFQNIFKSDMGTEVPKMIKPDLPQRLHLFKLNITSPWRQMRLRIKQEASYFKKEN